MSDPMNNNYLLTVVFSTLGGLLVLLSDFGGWTEGTYYGFNDYYLFIGSDNAPVLGQLLVLIIGAMLLLTSYFAYKGMNDTGSRYLKNAYQLSIISVILALVGAILFLIIASDAIDYWLDVGFYAGIIGSGVSFFFLNQSVKHN